MATLNPYLNFNGNAEEAFTFYKSVFGGEFLTVQRMKDVPPMPGCEVADNEKEKIMHIALPVGKGNIIMASDVIESMGHSNVSGNNFYISIQADSKEEAKHLFDGLSAGGTITMPLDDAFWNAYFGMFIDKFGIRWMVNYPYPAK